MKRRCVHGFTTNFGIINLFNSRSNKTVIKRTDYLFAPIKVVLKSDESNALRLFVNPFFLFLFYAKSNH